MSLHILPNSFDQDSGNLQIYGIYGYHHRIISFIDSILHHIKEDDFVLNTSTILQFYTHKKPFLHIVEEISLNNSLIWVAVVVGVVVEVVVVLLPLQSIAWPDTRPNTLR